MIETKEELSERAYECWRYLQRDWGKIMGQTYYIYYEQATDEMSFGVNPICSDGWECWGFEIADWQEIYQDFHFDAQMTAEQMYDELEDQREYFDEWWGGLERKE